MSRTRLCPHCGEEHPVELPACPKTKKPMERGASGLPKLRSSFAMQSLDDDDTKQGEIKPSLRRPVVTGPGALVGATLDDKYAIKSVLGAGGMGTVYAAENIRLGRPVAIKVLMRNSDPSAEKRFLKEARATGSINHPNICQIYDFGTTNGSPYIVMERLVGETLATRIARERALPIAEAAALIADVADGLAAAHEHNILHRDVKPDNVFLAKLGEEVVVKLVDFGIAKNIRRSGTMDTLTQVGTIVGTPDYMAPEQAAGHRDLDARVDVYACGVMLYEMLTGRRPFAAKHTHELLRLILAAAPTPPRAHREEIPVDLERVILVAMRKDKSERFASARDLSNALREIARSGTLSASTSIPAQASPALPSELATKVSRAPLDAMRTIEDPRKPDED